MFPPLSCKISALRISRGICNILSIPSAVENCSPLLTCAVILSTVVELTLHANTRVAPHISVHKDRAILLLGVLTRLGKVWSTANKAAEQLRVLANKIVAPDVQGPIQNTDSTDISAQTVLPTPTLTDHSSGTADDISLYDFLTFANSADISSFMDLPLVTALGQ